MHRQKSQAIERNCST